MCRSFVVETICSRTKSYLSWPCWFFFKPSESYFSLCETLLCSCTCGLAVVLHLFILNFQIPLCTLKFIICIYMHNIFSLNVVFPMTFCKGKHEATKYLQLMWQSPYFLVFCRILLSLMWFDIMLFWSLNKYISHLQSENSMSILFQ